MKKLLYFVLATFLLSCSYEAKFTIVGQLPSKKYDGEWIYLVPLVGANQHTVDSVRIKNGTFEFKGDSEKMCILRMRPILRLEMQELLVVTEKGITRVSIGANSTSRGTPQNNALQQWKDAQMNIVKTFMALQKAQTDKADAKVIGKLMAQSDSTKKAMLTLSTQIMKEQKDNTLGRFIYEQIFFSLDSKDKAAVEPFFKKKSNVL